MAGPVALVPPDARLTGLWSRSLLTSGTGERRVVDTTSDVTWLQAGILYVDLRLPAATGSVAAQQPAASGFAGRLVADGPWARWERLVDLQPPTGSLDEGALHDHGDRVVETGRHADHVEHWHRDPGPTDPVVALLLHERISGAAAVLVRVGAHVAWARGSAGPADAVGAEVAFGRPTGLGVVVDRSSGAARRGAVIALHRSGEDLLSDEPAPDGEVVRRRWAVRETEGDLADLPLTPA